jgi:hypothetical protein
LDVVRGEPEHPGDALAEEYPLGTLAPEVVEPPDAEKTANCQEGKGVDVHISNPTERANSSFKVYLKEK